MILNCCCPYVAYASCAACFFVLFFRGGFEGGGGGSAAVLSISGTKHTDQQPRIGAHPAPSNMACDLAYLKVTYEY